MASIFLIPDTAAESPALGLFVLAPPRSHTSKLRIFLEPSSGRLSYKYDWSSFVFRNRDDDVTFSLVNEVPNATISIVSHVSTDSAHPNSPNAKLVMVDRPAGNRVPDVGTVYPSTPTAPGVNQVTFKMNRPHFGSHEMVHLGLIVSVQRNGMAPELLLCDPQIGNGPP